MNYAVTQFSGMMIVILLPKCGFIGRRASNLLLLDRNAIAQLAYKLHFQPTKTLSPRRSINYTRETPTLLPLSESDSLTQVP